MKRKLKALLKSEKGLTLIELLAVIVILGIIAAIAIPSIGGIIQKSKVNAVKADAVQILNAAKLYVANEGVPTSDLGPTNLAPYVDGGTITSDYTVSVTVSGTTTTYTITTGDPIVAGDQTVDFAGATITDINANPSVHVTVADSE